MIRADRPPSLARLEEVTKRFGPSVALDRVSFGIGPGEVVAVLGPNGAGKSTAISILLGLRHPDAGSARLFGADPRTASRTTARRCGAAGNRLPGDAPGARGGRPRTRALRAAAPGTRRSTTDSSSGGSSRASSVGCRSESGGGSASPLRSPATRGSSCSTNRPPGSTARRGSSVWEAVRVHVQEGGALLLTTHQLEEADALADRLVLLEHGRVVADGLVAHLKAAAGLTVVRFRAPPGTDVEGAEREGPYVRILTRDGGVEVERLVRRGVSLVDLEVRPLTLEEALSVGAARMRLLLVHARAMTVELLRYPAYLVPTLLLPTVFFLFFVSARTACRCNGTDGDLRRLRRDRRRLLPVRRRHRDRPRLAVGGVPADAAGRTARAARGAPRLGCDLRLRRRRAPRRHGGRRRAAPRSAAARWACLAVALAAGTVPFACLGFALGYWAPPKAALPIANLLYLVLAYAGGLWTRPVDPPARRRGRLPLPPDARLRRCARLGGARAGHRLALLARSRRLHGDLRSRCGRGLPARRGAPVLVTLPGACTRAAGCPTLPAP